MKSASESPRGQPGNRLSQALFLPSAYGRWTRICSLLNDLVVIKFRRATVRSAPAKRDLVVGHSKSTTGRTPPSSALIFPPFLHLLFLSRHGTKELLGRR